MAYRQNFFSNNYADNNQKLGYSSVSKNYAGYNQGYSQRSTIIFIQTSHRIIIWDRSSSCSKINERNSSRPRRSSTTTWTTKEKPGSSSRTNLLSSKTSSVARRSRCPNLSSNSTISYTKTKTLSWKMSALKTS